jgi:hypothetical protein
MGKKKRDVSPPKRFNSEDGNYPPTPEAMGWAYVRNKITKL